VDNAFSSGEHDDGDTTDVVVPLKACPDGDNGPQFVGVLFSSVEKGLTLKFQKLDMLTPPAPAAALIAAPELVLGVDGIALGVFGAYVLKELFV